MGLLELLPAPFLTVGPRGLTYVQWLALPVLLIAAWIVGALLGRATRALLGAVARRTHVSWDDELVRTVGAPLTLAWTVGAARALLPLVGLHGDLSARIMKTAVFAVFFWLLLRLVRMGGKVVSSSEWSQARPATRSLVPLGARIAQVAVLAMAVVAVLADLGYPVASLVAGLGIGGLALALAGQKTVENLFGAFSIGVDQPFRVGDAINAENLVSGTVESIGLRSTRIRTMDRTLVTIPNGKIADMRVESFAYRDRMRFGATLGLQRGTTAAQMRAVLASIEEALRKQPKVSSDGITVRFKEIAASSLDIELQAFFLTTDYGEFQTLRQELLLALMEVVEQAGTTFALPTRVVELRGAV